MIDKAGKQLYIYNKQYNLNPKSSRKILNMQGQAFPK